MRLSRRTLAPAALLALIVAAPTRADDANQWLARVAQAARTHNYVGTIVYQRGNRVETLRIAHLNQGGAEYEKFVSLDGPPREVVRSQNDVRFYFPDHKLVRVEPLTFRKAFPSLSPEQQKSLKEHYNFKLVAGERVGGIAADVVAFEPKDGMRYGRRFWSDAVTGLLLKARVVNERDEVIEQFAFTDIQINAKIDKSMVEASWPTVPPDWTVKELAPGDVATLDTGWSVTRVPPGFTKLMEGFRKLRGRRNPVAQIVYSDGLTSITVLIEPFASAPPIVAGMQPSNGALNVYSVRMDDNLVTVMGEAPAATVRQIGNSVARR